MSVNKLKLFEVKFLPKNLEEGILYVSKEYNVAGHMCPCGCGNKIITPLTSTEWNLNIINDEPTLYPSIGNWQLPCKSHYWIREGEIEWSYQWSEEQITEGSRAEEERRKAYYEKVEIKTHKPSLIIRILNWFLGKKS